MNLALKATWTEPVAPEGGKTMSEVRVKEGESLENALKRFKRSCAKKNGRTANIKRLSAEAESLLLVMK